MNFEENNILILGAGPAGLACAMELGQTGKKATVIEKDAVVGGLAKTLIFAEGEYVFRTDIGPHRFLSKNQYLQDLIKNLLGENWLMVKRQTRQYIGGKFYDYPINAAQALKNIGLARSLGILFSYLAAIARFRLFRRPIKNFEDFIVANFGRKLGSFNMLNYSEKIWGIDCQRIHSDWAGQRISGLNLTQAMKNALLKKKENDGPKSLAGKFHYSRFGNGSIYEAMAEKIIGAGSRIEVDTFPVKITHKNKRIIQVELENKGLGVTISPREVVSSIPVTELLELLSPQPPVEVLQAAQKLKWRAQAYLFLTLNKEQVTQDNWTYFPGKEVPFSRISEMKNFSPAMSPKEKTSVLVEFFVNEEDAIWNLSKDELLNLAMPWFEKMKFFKKEEIRNAYLFKKKKAYPVYDLDYLKNLEIIKKYLDKFENLRYIGRSGSFRYANQDHCLEMGIAAARSISENRKYDADSTGGEKENIEN